MTGKAGKQGVFVISSERSYDALGRQTSATDANGVVLTSFYDLADRRTEQDDSFGGVVTSTYDAADRLTSRSLTATVGGQNYGLRVDLTYTADNQIASLSRFASVNATTPGSVTTYAYDAVGRTLSVSDQLSKADGSAAPVFSQTTGYDLGGRATLETDNFPLTPSTATYVYDGTPPPVGEIDDADDRLYQDASNEYLYDLQGNRLEVDGLLSGLPSWMYQYDAANRLTKASQYTTDLVTATAAYGYDPLGRRVAETDWTAAKTVAVGVASLSTTTVTSFAFDGESLWAQLGGDKSLQVRYGLATSELAALPGQVAALPGEAVGAVQYVGSLGVQVWQRGMSARELASWDPTGLSSELVHAGTWLASGGNDAATAAAENADWTTAGTAASQFMLGARDSWVGFADAMTFGATHAERHLGGVNAVNESSGAYRTGNEVGQGVMLAASVALAVGTGGASAALEGATAAAEAAEGTEAAAEAAQAVEEAQGTLEAWQGASETFNAVVTPLRFEGHLLSTMSDFEEGNYQGAVMNAVGAASMSFGPDFNVCDAEPWQQVLWKGLHAVQLVGAAVQAEQSLANLHDWHDVVDAGFALYGLNGAAEGLDELLKACFAAGTPLWAPDGPKAIERFRAGDLILARDEHDPDGPVAASVVEEAPVHFQRILTSI